ncbi:MAG: TonB-dependent receptor, partial [Sphingomonadaceae bacterium]|nr:TonB-dependent receptor [Sphingomonadaceae bacterium]
MSVTRSDHAFSRRGISLAAILSATAMTAPFAITPALAQSAEEAGSNDNVIIVTAQRREEALKDVPMSVTVLDQQALTNAGVGSVKELTAVTTGFMLANGGSVPSPAIRGVNTVINGAYENNVSLYIDGVYQSAPHALTIDIPNIQNVQVLKGPQGTLYGRNATGGAILLTTLEPTDTWEGKVQATYGRFDERSVGGFVSGPLAEGMGIVVSGYTRRRDGYVDKMSRTNPGEIDGKAFPIAQDAFRAKLKFEFSPSFNATLGYGFTHTDDGGLNASFGPIENTVPFFGNAAGAGPLRPTKLGQAAPNLDTGVEVDQHEFFMKLDLDLGIGTLRTTTAYTDIEQSTIFDFDGTYAEITYSESGFVDQTFQQLVDLNLDLGDSLNLLVGGQYFRIKTDTAKGAPDYGYSGTANGSFLTYDPLAEQPLSDYAIGSETRYDRVKEAWALFADATLQATDQLSFIVGGRYSEETQTNTLAKWGAGGEQGGVVTFPSTTKSSKYTKFTPRASIVYEITPDTNVYASYSKGFKSGEWPGSFSGDPDDWQDVKQETVDGFEVGLKHAGSGIRFDLAAFYMDYKNLQVSFVNFVDSSAVVLLQNAPSAEIYGMEANFDAELFENFNLRGGVTYLHARYGDNFIFSGLGVNPNAPGLNTNSDPLKTFLNVNPVEQDVSGRRMARAPDWTAFLGFDYLVPNEDGGLRFAANVKWTDKYVVSNPSLWGGWYPDPSQPGYDA